MFSLGVLWSFRLVHILSAVFWVGGMLIFARFLFPTVQALGPAAGPVMDHLSRVRQLPRALVGAAVASILSGVGLYWHDSMGFRGDWMASPTGTVFGLGALLAIIAFVIGVTINAPTAKQLGALAATIHGQGKPPSPDQAAAMQRLQRRLGAALRAVVTLLVLATAAMALARYVRW